MTGKEVFQKHFRNSGEGRGYLYERINRKAGKIKKNPLY